MAAAKTHEPTFPELIQLAEVLAEPIDFDQLIADGVIAKAGRWFEVLDPSGLPEHARVKIRALKSGNRVKFREPGKRLLKFVRAQEAEPAEPHKTNGQAPKRRREKALV